MATSTEVAGISIGISADVGGLDASLRTASTKVDNWARRTQNRRVQVTVDAIKGDSWKTIEAEFAALIDRVTKGQRIPVDVDFDVNPRQLNELYARLYNTIRTQVGTRKIPVDVSYKTKIDVEAKAHVNVTWSWADGSGPPGDLNVAVGNAQRSTTTGTATQGRRRTASGAGDTTSRTASAEAPAQVEPENFGQRMARLNRERRAAATPPVEPPTTQRATVTRTRASAVRQQPTTVQPTTATVEEVSGIAAMGTATPRTAAGRQREAVIKANTEAHRAETAATKEWVKVNRARAREIVGADAPAFKRGAKGFTAEMQTTEAGAIPTGRVRYAAGDQKVTVLPTGPRPSRGAFERQAHAPVPDSMQPVARAATSEDELIADILSLVSPEEGAALKNLGVVPASLPKETRKKLQSRINKAIVGRIQRNERRQTRTPSGVDWRSERWFNSPDSGVDAGTRRAAEEAFQADMSAQEEEEWARLKDIFGATDKQRETIIRNWAGKSERWGKLVSTYGKGGIEKLAKTLGEVLEFSAADSDKTIQEAARLMEEGEYNAAREVLLPIRLQTRRAILENARSPAVGAQRAARLRGGAGKTGKTVTPSTPEETAYMAATAIQQQIEQREAWARQDDIRAGGVEKGQETKAGKRQQAAKRAYIEEFGPVPEAPKGLTPQQMAEREGGVPEDWMSSEWREYQDQLKDFWADFRDFEKEWKPPKRERKATGKGTLGDPASQVPLSPRNLETAAMANRLGELQMAEEDNLDFDPDEMADLVEKLERRANMRGSRSTRIGKGGREYTWDPPSEAYNEILFGAIEDLVAKNKKARAPLQVSPEEQKYEDEYMDWIGSMSKEDMGLLRRTHDESFIPSDEERRRIDLLQAGSPRYGMQGSSLRDRIQRGPAPKEGEAPPPPKEEAFVPVWRRRDQSGVRQPRLEGSSAALEGLPTEVPDVRDLGEALGIGRLGFQAGQPRRVISSGVLKKLRSMTKGADVEKAAFLIGESYVDAVGRQLDVITEAVEAEAEATGTGFKTKPGATQAVVRRLRANRRSRLMGGFHGIEGHGLAPSRRDDAANPDLNDEDFLKQAAQHDPNYLSLIGDPAAGGGFDPGFAAFGVSPLSGEVRPRRLNVVRNPSAILRENVRPVSVVAPERAEAQSPVALEGLTRQIAEAWDDATDDMRESWTNTFSDAGWQMPTQMQEWAAARAQSDSPYANGTLFGEVTGGALGPSPFRWNMGAAGATAQPGPQGPAGAYVPPQFGAGPPPLSPAAAVAAMGGGFFGVPPGNAGGAGGVPPMAPPPVPGGGGGPPPFGGRNRGQYNRSYEAIRQDLLRMDVPEKRIADIEDQYELDFESTFDFINAQKTELQNRLGATPVRALSTAVGQFIAQRVARGPAQAAQRKANLLLRQQERAAQTQMQMGMRAEGTLDLLKQERATGISQATGEALTPDDIKNRQRELAFFRGRRNVAKAEVAGLEDPIKQAVKATAPLSLQLANLAALTPAIVAGGVIFQAAMAAAQAGLEAIGKVAMDGAEAGTGYNATLRRTQDALAEQAMQTGGVRGAVAGAFGAAGMEGTAAQRAALEGRVGAVTATNRFIQQRDLLRSLENINQNAPGASRYGIDAALVRPTGGMFGTAIGAQQSLDEIIGNELERLNPSGAAGLFNMLNERAPFTGSPFEGNFELFGLTEAGKAREQAQTDFADSLNRELESVGNNAKFALGGLGFGTPERDAQARALDDLGANEIAAAVRAGAYEIRDANGQIVTEEEKLAQIVKDLGEALQMPSGTESYRAGERARRSAMMGIENGFQNTVNITNPISDWRRLALQRPLAFGAGWNSGDPSSQAAQAAFGGGFQDSMASLNRRMAEGRREAINLGVDPADITRLEEFGDQIRGINTDLVNRRLEVNTASYNQQLKMATYSLEDIRGITGQIGAGTSAIGRAQGENLRLQREGVEISRRMQERQMDLTQGQINYNLAVSKFSGGGASAAEAFAKREQARIEAEFAQANLNDQRQLFENEGIINTNTIAVVDEQNLRALEQAIFAVEQLDRERELEKYSAAAEQFLGVLTDEANILAAEIDAQISRGMDYVTLAQEEIRRVYQESGEVLTGVSEDISDAFEQIREDYDEWLGDLTPLRTGRSRGGEWGEPTNSGGSGGGASGSFASGGLFDTAGAYSMTVGEAGKETVAVLRNPRQVRMGGGGQGVTININNPVVRDDSDIVRLAQAVEQVLNQRTALLGLRR